ncbi:MAG: sugar ABC transporter substrate-binding protein [Spirochaetaceae bacterium]
MTKKILALLLLVTLVSTVFASGTNESKSGNPQVAVLFPGSVEFFMIQRKGMDEAAKEFGLDLIYSDAEWDAGKQLTQMENFVARGVDVILLCSADNIALLPSIELCQDAGIPLITFTNILGEDPTGDVEGVESFIGINDEYLGFLMGEMAESLLGNEPSNIVLIEGTAGTAPQRLRSKAFKEVVAKHSNWNIIYSQSIPGWTKEGALGAVEASLQKGEKIDLISCQWYSAASAAAEAVEEAGLDYKVNITGLEFSKELIPYIKEGKVDMTSNASISSMGYIAVQTASKVLNGDKVDKIISIIPEIVSIENVDSVVAEL